MEINKALFARYAELDERERKALEGDNIGAYREASVALIEIINELAVLDLEFKVIDDTLCLAVKPQEQQHQWTLRRSYQFPNAVKFIDEGDCFVGWVVNEIGGEALYGVVRYIVKGDSIAWLESACLDGGGFGANANAAEQWVRETIASLKAGK